MASRSRQCMATIGKVSGAGMPGIDAVGYRVVHPGPKLDQHVRIADTVMRDLEEAVVFAPLHDPSAIEIIREMMARQRMVRVMRLNR